MDNNFMDNSLGYLVCLGLYGTTHQVTRDDIEYVEGFLNKPLTSGNGPQSVIREALSRIENRIKEDLPENIANRQHFGYGNGTGESQIRTLERIREQAPAPGLADTADNPYFLVVRAAQHMRNERIRSSLNGHQETLISLRDAIIEKSQELNVDIDEELELYQPKEEFGESFQPEVG